MTNNDAKQHRAILRRIARRVMLQRGLAPDFTDAALSELKSILAPATPSGKSSADLRRLLWCSIDNDDSRDLDQLTVAETMPGGEVKVLVAIADVDALVKKGMALDQHAEQNTTSVYTAGQIFPMLPEKLSTDLTSLNPDADRCAMVTEMVFAKDGALQSSAIYPAVVHNRAKLAYNSVAAWFEGKGPMPAAIGAVPGLEETLRLQDKVAQRLKSRRHVSGSLDFQTIQTRAIFEGEMIKELEPDQSNRAKDLIAEFMIAANGVVARYLAAHHFPVFERVVRTPDRWDRIVELAVEHNATLPAEPDSKALEDFLVTAKAQDPVGFPDLSLCIIKLLGRGEYVAQTVGDKPTGHFGLAVRDYSHSTAPNRRYPDVITQRLLKAAIAGRSLPYERTELSTLAQHCTQAEDAAKKVERHVGKSAAALLLEGRIGEEFDAIVTGASDKGTWVRIFQPPVEGRLESGTTGLDVGKRVRVALISTDVERGHIDFKRVG